MPVLDEIETLQDHRRITYLESRVAALERTIAQLSLRIGTMSSAKAANTQPMSILVAPRGLPTAPAADAKPKTDTLGITASFESLDMRLAEEAASEATLHRRTSFEAPVVEIDPSLIDKAFARPPSQKITVSASLEELHPKILERICMTWRTAELLQYLNRLIVDERGDRAGFDPGVMSELLLLSAILEAPDAGDTWSANARTL